MKAGLAQLLANGAERDHRVRSPPEHDLAVLDRLEHLNLPQVLPCGGQRVGRQDHQVTTHAILENEPLRRPQTRSPGRGCKPIC